MQSKMPFHRYSMNIIYLFIFLFPHHFQIYVSVFSFPAHVSMGVCVFGLVCFMRFWGLLRGWYMIRSNRIPCENHLLCVLDITLFTRDRRWFIVPQHDGKALLISLFFITKTFNGIQTMTIICRQFSFFFFLNEVPLIAFTHIQMKYVKCF